MLLHAALKLNLPFQKIKTKLGVSSAVCCVKPDEELMGKRLRILLLAIFLWRGNCVLLACSITRPPWGFGLLEPSVDFPLTVVFIFCVLLACSQHVLTMNYWRAPFFSFSMIRETMPVEGS